jgi:hypothetical protein
MEANMRRHIGEVACNPTNGVYRGRVIAVTTIVLADQEPTLVYVVEQDG